MGRLPARLCVSCAPSHRPRSEAAQSKALSALYLLLVEETVEMDRWNMCEADRLQIPNTVCTTDPVCSIVTFRVCFPVCCVVPSSSRGLFRLSVSCPYLLQTKAPGQALLTEVFLRGNLIESDYFGLEFQNMQMNWVCTQPSVCLGSCSNPTG